MEKSYIIGTYNKFDQWDRAHSTYIFELNGYWYAIKEVELEWGTPVLPQRMDRNDDEAQSYQVYATEQDALQFVHTIRSLN